MGAVRARRSYDLVGVTLVTYSVTMKPVELWVDGACQPNPGHGGWAALLVHDGTERMLSGGEGMTTTNRMEMMAALQGLRALKERCEVTIFTDSKILSYPFIAGWRRKKNLDLWDQLDEELAKHDVSWRLVKGHSGVERNERVDEVAEGIARGQRVC
jgi:ribonuclease HI